MWHVYGNRIITEEELDRYHRIVQEQYLEYEDLSEEDIERIYQEQIDEERQYMEWVQKDLHE